MPTINPDLPDDGDDASVSAYNPIIIAILALLNGGLDGDNIASSFTDNMTVGDLTITGDLTIQGNQTAAGWNPLGSAVPTTITYLGNRSYSLAYSDGIDYTSLVSAGMRLMTTRTAAAPTQCTSLSGTSQYYSRATGLVAGMTFTDDFVVGAHGKPTAYGTKMVLASRFDGTSGWELFQDTTGQIVLRGYNAGAANYSEVRSYQSVSLSKWSWVVAQLDMSAFTATTTTSYITIDGIDVSASVVRAGTNPVALVQAGSLMIGASNSTTPASFYNGKLAQVFVSSAKITQANVRTLYSQGLTPALITANSIISAYSFNNSIIDLNTTNANNLTANGGVVATNADAPWTQNASNTPTGDKDCMIVQKATFSVNTTFTVQVPEGCTIPTSGGVSAVAYSSAGKPYGMPTQKGKFYIDAVYMVNLFQASPVVNTWYNFAQITTPAGEWEQGYETTLLGFGSSSSIAPQSTLSTSSSAVSDTRMSAEINGSNVLQIIGQIKKEHDISLAVQTPLYLLARYIAGTSVTNLGFVAGDVPTIIRLKNAYV